jgi:hypothetical protein
LVARKQLISVLGAAVCILTGVIATAALAAVKVPLPQPKPALGSEVAKPRQKPNLEPATKPLPKPKTETAPQESNETAKPPAVPVPRPKPALSDPAPRPIPDADAETPAKSVPEEGEQPESETPPEVKPALPPRPPFDLAAARVCEAELKGLGAEFRVAEDVSGEGSCGLQRPIHLKSLKGGVDVTGDPIMTCTMARGLAQWMTEVVIPSAELHLKARPSALHIGTSYQCRNRYGSIGGKISEHAFGNAVDISGLSFTERGPFQVQVRNDDTPDRPFQAAIRAGGCAYFTTVLGPTTNEAHSTHLHFDAIARRGGYRLCE